VCNRTSGSLFPIGVTTVTCTATDDSGLTDTDTFTVTVTVLGNAPGNPPGTPSASAYTALSGARLADTRPGQPTADSLFAGQGIRSAGSTLELTVAGRGGVAPDAAAVALNVTAVGGTGDGHVTVYPCGSDQPTASNLNFTSGAVIPNAVIAKIGTAGKVCLFVSAPTHLVVDVSGYFPLGTSLRSLNPARLLDTRAGQPTFDRQQEGNGAAAGGSVTAVQITGRASVPNDASAVVLNVTVTGPQGPGFATVFPCGAAVPNASNLNYVAGATVANLIAAKIGDGGSVCVYTSQPTHVIVDVAGFFPAGSSYTSLVPARLLDTRATGSTIDGQFVGAGAPEAGEVTELTVTNRGGVPAGAATVVLNVTVTEPSAAGFVTVYPCGIATPLASNLNFEAGATGANAVIAKVGADGKVCLFTSRSTQLIVDVNGFFPSG
jgi:HYR domain